MGVFFPERTVEFLCCRDTAQHLRDRIYAHVQEPPYDYHVKAETGDLLQRCTSDVDNIRRFLNVQLMSTLTAY